MNPIRLSLDLPAGSISSCVRKFALLAGLAILALLIAWAPCPAASNQPQLAPVQLNARRRQLIGLKLATVEEKELHDRIETTAIVEPDEQLESFVQTRFAGWIRDVFVNQTYQYVRKGQPLFTIYSPDLVSAEQEYLLALTTAGDLRRSKVKGVASGAESLVNAALERLRLFGVPSWEIRRLKRQRSVRDAVAIAAPSSGYVVKWSALPNQYVQPQARLYTIANLSKVWLYAAVFQNQLGEVKVGDPVSVTVDAYPGKTFKGRVDFIWQAIDPTTRTARVRCEFSNSDNLLKLGMYARIALEPRLGRGLAIPASGVLRTGARNIVFIDEGNGYLQPTEVELGPRVGNSFVVRKGLQAGERIVSSANFLIDSESQLQAALGTFMPPPPGAGAHANAPAAAIELTTEPSPLRRGLNRALVTVRDSSGRVVSGARVSLIFFMPAMPAMGMSARRVEVNAKPLKGGRYAADINLPNGGTWNVTVIAIRAEKTIASRQLTMTATGAM